jgi:hypothetical protein
MPDPAQAEFSVDAGSGADAEELERLVSGLRRELLELDAVDAAVSASAGPAPAGSRAVEALLAGAVLVRFARNKDVLSAVMKVVRGWLGEQGQRRVRVELDGDVLELTGASDQERDRLVEAWIERHARD